MIWVHAFVVSSLLRQQFSNSEVYFLNTPDGSKKLFVFHDVVLLVYRTVPYSAIATVNCCFMALFSSTVPCRMLHDDSSCFCFVYCTTDPQFQSSYSYASNVMGDTFHINRNLAFVRDFAQQVPMRTLETTAAEFLKHA